MVQHKIRMAGIAVTGKTIPVPGVRGPDPQRTAGFDVAPWTVPDHEHLCRGDVQCGERVQEGLRRRLFLFDNIGRDDTVKE